MEITRKHVVGRTIYSLWLKKVAQTDVKPRLSQCCGTEDLLYKDNLRFRDHTRKLGLDLMYEEGTATHAWGYWDIMIQKVLNWLPLGKVGK